MIVSSKLVDLAGVAYLFSDVARLLWRDAQGIEGSLDLASTEIKVGRAMDCAIRTDDAMVSRHHARIFWGGGGYVLEDLSSARVDIAVVAVRRHNQISARPVAGTATRASRDSNCMPGDHS